MSKLYVGSACVYGATFISILAFHSHFNTVQLAVALLAIPVLITLAEAFSPHTWDSPLIYGVGGIALIGVRSNSVIQYGNFIVPYLLCVN